MFKSPGNNSEGNFQLQFLRNFLIEVMKKLLVDFSEVYVEKFGAEVRTAQKIAVEFSAHATKTLATLYGFKFTDIIIKHVYTLLRNSK